MELVVKNLPVSVGDVTDAGLIPGLGRFPGRGHGNPLQYSCMEFPQAEESGGLQVQGVTRVGHNLLTKPSPANIYIYAC